MDQHRISLSPSQLAANRLHPIVKKKQRILQSNTDFKLILLKLLQFSERNLWFLISALAEWSIFVSEARKQSRIMEKQVVEMRVTQADKGKKYKRTIWVVDDFTYCVLSTGGMRTHTTMMHHWLLILVY